MRVKFKRLTYIALMAVVICVCSWLTVPFTVPFTMQTFGVFCALLLLGGKDGTAAVGIYILMGLVGLPVFSGFRGGAGHIFGPTGGYIIGFLFTGLVYMLTEPWITSRRSLRWASLAVGLILCYMIGTVWFTAVFARRGTYYSLPAALGMCVLPYVIPDFIKMALAVYVSDRVNVAIDKNAK